VLVALGALLAGCTSVKEIWRPEGDGGWTPAQRQAAVSVLAPSAGVENPREPRPTPMRGKTNMKSLTTISLEYQLCPTDTRFAVRHQ
jgi:hypothetical protein